MIWARLAGSSLFMTGNIAHHAYTVKHNFQFEILRLSATLGSWGASVPREGVLRTVVGLVDSHDEVGLLERSMAASATLRDVTSRAWAGLRCFRFIFLLQYSANDGSAAQLWRKLGKQRLNGVVGFQKI